MRFIKRIFKKIRDWYVGLTIDVKQYIPIAINVVEGIKKFMESDVDDIIAEIIKMAIPGNVDDIIIDNVKEILEEWIPIILNRLSIIDKREIRSEEDFVKVNLHALKNSNIDMKHAFYHNFATLILQKLLNDKLTKSECIILTEYYYVNEFKKQKLPISN